MSLASGNQAITGAGFKPRAIFAFATASPGSAGAQQSVGMASDGTPIANAVWANAANIAASNTVITLTQCIQIIDGGGQQYAGAVASFDADGFTLTWTRTGAKTGTLTVLAFCIA
jgi:hypothetical protein